MVDKPESGAPPLPPNKNPGHTLAHSLGAFGASVSPFRHTESLQSHNKSWRASVRMTSLMAAWQWLIWSITARVSLYVEHTPCSLRNRIVHRMLFYVPIKYWRLLKICISTCLMNYVELSWIGRVAIVQYSISRYCNRFVAYPIC